jgi:hypothetical protein
VNRSEFIKSIIGAFGISVLPKKSYKQYEKIYLLKCFVRGFTYYEGPKLIKELNADQQLELVREPENEHDGKAIALYYNQQKIGFIPRENNYILSKLIDAKLLDLQAEIKYVNPDASDWNKLYIKIYVLKEINNKTNSKVQSLTETNKYYSAKNTNDSYTRIYKGKHTNNFEPISAVAFYDNFSRYSNTKNATKKLHKIFRDTDSLENALQESRFIINKNKLPESISLEDIAQKMENQILQIGKLFGEKDYVVANVNQISKMPNFIEKLVVLTDKSGNRFYEILFST